ncbi:MAG: type 1 glutamine amidotransferase [Mariprofundales bacterium]|nr:type 1 glutamine amidotransferase [Mariprofundales bacterium]
MNKQVLVIQQVEHEPPALIGSALTAAGITLHTLLAESNPIPDHAHDYCGVVVMGGPASANDSTPAIQQQLTLLKWCIAQQKATLGICLGAQLLAKAANGTITPSPIRELGWYPLLPTAIAAQDPLFQHLTQPVHLFQWHGESFTLPPDANLLASSPEVPNQAFRIAGSLYGLQFHAEVDAALIDSWISHGASERIHLGQQGIDAIKQQTPIHLPDGNALCQSMVQSWIKLLDPR